MAHQCHPRTVSPRTDEIAARDTGLDSMAAAAVALAPDEGGNQEVIEGNQEAIKGHQRRHRLADGSVRRLRMCRCPARCWRSA